MIPGTTASPLSRAPLPDTSDAAKGIAPEPTGEAAAAAADAVVKRGEEAGVVVEKISEEKGYETLVKQMQYYLLYVLPSVAIQAKAAGHLDLPGNSRLKQLNVDDDTGNLSANSIMNRTTYIPTLRKIPPNLLSYLTPMIRVYKTIYPGGFKKENELAFQVPFDDNIVPVDATGESVDKILSARAGGLDLANIMSFDYQFIGTNPAEAETAITAKLKLKFLSVESLLKERTILGEADKTKTDKPRVIKFRYSDLVNQAKKDSSDYYRLKIKVGYQKIRRAKVEEILGAGDNVESFNSKYMDELTAAINHSNTYMYLYPVTHDLNFNDNGTIELTIDFRGAIERSMTGDYANVLLVGADARAAYDAVKTTQAKIQKKDADLEEKRRKKELSDDQYASERQRLDLELKKDFEAARRSNWAIYNGFIQYLYKKKQIRCINFNPGAFGKDTAGSLFSNATVMDNTVLRSSISTQFIVPDNSIINYQTVDDKYTDSLVKILVSQASDANSAASSGEASTSAGKAPKAAVYANKLPDKINFIFFQDLVQAIFDIPDINISLEIDDLYLLLGNIMIPTATKYLDVTTGKPHPGLFLSNIATREVGIGDVPLIQYNIGTLPICLELFNKWFINQVVKPGKIEWKLKHFLYDVMELLRYSTMAIFGNRVSGSPSTRTLLNASTISKQLANHIKEPTNSIVSFKGINVSALASSDEGIVDSNPKDISNLLFLYVPTIDALNIPVTNPAELEEKFKMFVFTVGSNVGLLKKINYKRMEIPGIREARATQEGELATGTFRMKYDADIEMYGPCYFRPGDMVVINPIFLSRTDTLTTMTTLARDLGLGGIYMVLKTTTDISRDGIYTKLETVFQSYGNLLKKYNITRAEMSDQDMIDMVTHEGSHVAYQVIKRVINERFNDITDEKAQKLEKQLLLRAASGGFLDVDEDLLDGMK